MTFARASLDVQHRVAEAGGDALVERLLHLERRVALNRDPATALDVPDKTTPADFDVAILGGGLWSILAPVLAARGLNVAVVERARAGAAHREWNASYGEVRRLVEAGLVTDEELDELIVARYESGVCQFRGGPRYSVRGVLDCAVDATALLSLARRRGEAARVTYLDGHDALAHASGPGSVCVRVRCGDLTNEFVATLVVDARGVSSPHARPDLMCPTVGGVLAGLTEGPGPRMIDPKVGEILVTVDGIEAGRQHVWEAFPGRVGETAVYLFYYARANERTSLLDLYARFFATLPSFKEGTSRLLRPTFGFIPGWSRLSPGARPPDDRVILVGDAAALHSPLTYCGFGASLRALAPTVEAICSAISERRRAPSSIQEDLAVHRLTGALAYLMASRSFEGDDLNRLLDAAFGTLHEMGEQPYVGLLRDEMDPRAFVAFLRRTAKRHPAVWPMVLRGMGMGLAGKWAFGVARAVAASPA